MNELGRWQDESGLDDEQMAAFMSERLGKPITPHGVHTVVRRRNPPQLWLEVLELTPQEPGGGGEEQPLKPPQKPTTEILPFEPVSARAQIIMLYTFAGKGAAQALRSPDVEGVWAGHAPQIADAYIDWAKVNPTVAKVIAAATLGGPAGQVVLLHGSLVVSTLIVSGRISGMGLVPPPMRPTEPPQPPLEEEELIGSEPDLGPEAAADNGASTKRPAAQRRQRPVRPLE